MSSQQTIFLLFLLESTCPNREEMHKYCWAHVFFFFFFFFCSECFLHSSINTTEAKFEPVLFMLFGCNYAKYVLVDIIQEPWYHVTNANDVFVFSLHECRGFSPNNFYPLCISYSKTSLYRCSLFNNGSSFALDILSLHTWQQRKRTIFNHLIFPPSTLIYSIYSINLKWFLLDKILLTDLLKPLIAKLTLNRKVFSSLLSLLLQTLRL